MHPQLDQARAPSLLIIDDDSREDLALLSTGGVACRDS
jgi:hypothetical protein